MSMIALFKMRCPMWFFKLFAKEEEFGGWGKFWRWGNTWRRYPTNRAE